MQVDVPELGSKIKPYMYIHVHVYAYMYTCTCTFTCCYALFVCLTLLASFFLPSHLSLKHVHVHLYLQYTQCCNLSRCVSCTCTNCIYNIGKSMASIAC